MHDIDDSAFESRLSQQATALAIGDDMHQMLTCRIRATCKRVRRKELLITTVSCLMFLLVLAIPIIAVSFAQRDRVSEIIGSTPQESRQLVRAWIQSD